MSIQRPAGQLSSKKAIHPPAPGKSFFLNNSLGGLKHFPFLNCEKASMDSGGQFETSIALLRRPGARPCPEPSCLVLLSVCLPPLTPGLLFAGPVPIETSAELAGAEKALHAPSDCVRAPPIPTPDFSRLSRLRWARWRLITSLLFFPSPCPLPSPPLRGQPFQETTHSAHLAQCDREAHHGYRATIPTPAAAPGNK